MTPTMKPTIAPTTKGMTLSTLPSVDLDAKLVNQLRCIPAANQQGHYQHDRRDPETARRRDGEHYHAEDDEGHENPRHPDGLITCCCRR